MFRFLFAVLLIAPINLFGGYFPDSDSLKKELKRTHSDSIKVKILIKLSESKSVGQDSAYLYSIEALNIARRIHYKFGIGDSYRSLISFAKNKAEIDSLVEMSTEFFSELKNRQYESLVLLSAAIRCLTIGNNYVTAFQYANLFLANYKNKKDRESFAKAWNVLGEVYRISKNYKLALDAYRNSEKYAVLNGKILFLSPLINIGTIQLNLGYLDSALNRYDFIERQLIDMQEAGSNSFAYIKYRKAQVFLLGGRFRNALNQATNGFEIYDKLGHNEGRILTWGVLAEIHFKTGSYQESILFGKRAIDLAKRINYVINDIGNVCEVVAKSYGQLGDFENAYRYQIIQSDLTNKAFNPEIAATLINDQLKLEKEKIELQKELSEEQRQKDQSIIQGQKLINLASIAIILALSGVTFLFYRNARVKQRLNLQLQEKQEEILAQTEELTAQTEELRASNEKIEAINANLGNLVNDRTATIKNQNLRLRDYAYFNAHKVRGPLARILGLISIIEYEFPHDAFGPYKKMLKESSIELDKAIREINIVLEEEK